MIFNISISCKGRALQLTNLICFFLSRNTKASGRKICCKGNTKASSTCTNSKSCCKAPQESGYSYKSLQFGFFRGQRIDSDSECVEIILIYTGLFRFEVITCIIRFASVAKLLTLTNSQNAAKLRRHIYVAGRAKSDNENGYYIVDAINDAIDTKRKISFRYTDFDVTKHRYIANDGEPYTVSPYTLIWDGDYYYMRGFCDERQEMRNFRLDRISEQPKILNQIAVMPPEGYTPADYSKHVFRMYDTDEPVSVQLHCHVSVMKYLIDKFGSDFETVVVDDEHFKATVSVCPSTTFYSWVFGFNGKIKVEGPQGVVEAYKEMLVNALNEM